MSPVPEGATSAKGKDDGKGAGPTVESTVGTEMAVLTDLQSALQGVAALGAVIALMEQAANGIVTATTDGKVAINDYVATNAKPEIWRYVNEDMRRAINSQAGEAVKLAVENNMSHIVDSVLGALIRRGLTS